MAAQIPIKDDKKANEIAMANVKADKLREVRAGHDGTWIAHPALASIAAEVFNKHMPTPNQLFVRKDNVRVTQNDLLNMNVPGTITEEGIRKNLNIGLGYIEGWLRGIGCVPINYLMVGPPEYSQPNRTNQSNNISRRMLLPRKSVVASSGNGVAMVLRQPEERESTRRTQKGYSKSKQTNCHPRHPEATSTILQRSISLLKSPVTITRIFCPRKSSLPWRVLHFITNTSGQIALR